MLQSTPSRRSRIGDTWNKKDCILPGRRKWEARLNDITGSWESACAIQPVSLNKLSYTAPHRCINYGWLQGMWGEVWERDTTCDTSWKQVTDMGCMSDKPGFRQFRATLGVSLSGSVIDSKLGPMWQAWCQRIGLTVQGTFFSAPDK